MIEEYVNSFVNDLQRIDDEYDGERLIDDTVSDALDEFEHELRARLERELRDYIEEECSECSGTGECYECDGTGEIDEEICSECGGTGECSTCEGSGSAHVLH